MNIGFMQNNSNIKNVEHIFLMVKKGLFVNDIGYVWQARYKRASVIPEFLGFRSQLYMILSWLDRPLFQPRYKAYRCNNSLLIALQL